MYANTRGNPRTASPAPRTPPPPPHRLPIALPKGSYLASQLSASWFAPRRPPAPAPRRQPRRSAAPLPSIPQPPHLPVMNVPAPSLTLGGASCGAAPTRRRCCVLRPLSLDRYGFGANVQHRRPQPLVQLMKPRQPFAPRDIRSHGLPQDIRPALHDRALRALGQPGESCGRARGAGGAGGAWRRGRSGVSWRG